MTLPDPDEVTEQDYKDMDDQHINSIIDEKMGLGPSVDEPEDIESESEDPSVDEYAGNPPDPDFELDEFTLKAEMVGCTVKLSKEQGSLLKDLITEVYPHTFPHYCTKVGISTPNFYNTVNGERPCSIEFFNKLLSGIGYRATMLSTEILIQEVETGEIVNDANCISQESGSSSEEKGEQGT